MDDLSSEQRHQDRAFRPGSGAGAPEENYGNQFLGYQEYDEQEPTQFNPRMSYVQSQYDQRYQSNGGNSNRESRDEKA